MAKIKNLKMAEVLSSDPRINITTSFFGLSQSAVYVPTGSKLAAFQNEYSQEKGETLKQLLSCPDNQLETFVKKHAPLEPITTGPSRLEGCVSADHQFAALQLLGYSNFEYHALTGVKTYEGAAAELISKLFA